MSSVRSAGFNWLRGLAAHNARTNSCHAGGPLLGVTLTGRTHLNRVESHCKAVSRREDNNPKAPAWKERRFSEGPEEELMGSMVKGKERRRGDGSGGLGWGARWPSVLKEMEALLVVVRGWRGVGMDVWWWLGGYVKKIILKNPVYKGDVTPWTECVE